MDDDAGDAGDDDAAAAAAAAQARDAPQLGAAAAAAGSCVRDVLPGAPRDDTYFTLQTLKAALPGVIVQVRKGKRRAARVRCACVCLCVGGRVSHQHPHPHPAPSPRLAPQGIPSVARAVITEDELCGRTEGRAQPALLLPAALPVRPRPSPTSSSWRATTCSLSWARRRRGAVRRGGGSAGGSARSMRGHAGTCGACVGLLAGAADAAPTTSSRWPTRWA